MDISSVSTKQIEDKATSRLQVKIGLSFGHSHRVDEREKKIDLGVFFSATVK